MNCQIMAGGQRPGADLLTNTKTRDEIMKSLLAALASALVLVASASRLASAADDGALDIKRAIPTSVHMALYVKHNAERDYQRQYFADAWKTFQDEKIAQRLFDIIQSRAPKDKLDKLQDAWDQVKEAVEPINGEALMEAKECAIGQML